jgi:phosphatidylglycerol lysyltransferase
MPDRGNAVQVTGLDTPLIVRRSLERLRVWVAAHRYALILAAMLVVGLLAFEALRTILLEVHFRDVRHALATVPPARIALAVALTGGSYLALTFYDLLALRTIGRPLPWRTAALASFTSYTLSNNLGLSLLTGGSARLRVYSEAGLDLADVARVILLASCTFWSGIMAVGGTSLLLAGAPLIVGGFQLSVLAEHLLGALLLGTLAAVMLLRLSGTAQIRLGTATLPLPAPPILATQIATASLDLACASGVLFVLVPGLDPSLFGAFFLAYALAIIVALITHVPGGLGVFEATILALLPMERSGLFAALLLYRLIYYFLPLAVAGGLVLGLEGKRLRQPVAIGLSAVQRAVETLMPSLSAVLAFGGGIVLLVSGALPALPGRMHSLDALLPLPFIEASHFGASLAGTALLLIAPALQARLRSGLIAARLVLLAGAAFSIFKGFDYEEAAVLLLVAGLFHQGRDAFYREAGIGAAPFVRWWWAAALVTVAFSAWVGLFAYKHVPYSQTLWWDFAWHGDAPRFLRATLGATVLLGAWAFWRLMSVPPRVAERRDLPVEVAERAIAATGRADAMLAFTGDKSFLVSAAGDAFLMYRVHGRSWITMGDPVGPHAAWSELVWELRRRSDAAHGRLCLFQVSAAMLPLVVELGLQPIKYGDEAVIDLTGGYDLAGPAFKSLRYSVKRASAAGLAFNILAPSEVRAHAEALAAVSRAWLAGKAGAEKGFSLGRFDLAYLERFPCAVLRLEGRIVAFANLWTLPNQEELSVDLMRHLPDTPYGAMDFLFVRLLQYGASAGYRRFNLGLAPLSGLPSDRLAPAWARLGTAVYGHGERVYGFSGLRAFKNKFSPIWEPRYIAFTGGLSAPRALVDLAALIGK